jgi:hypothetical protein
MMLLLSITVLEAPDASFLLVAAHLNFVVG